MRAESSEETATRVMTRRPGFDDPAEDWVEDRRDGRAASASCIGALDGGRTRPARARRVQRAALYSAWTAAIATVLVLVGPPGNDAAAHVYQRMFFLQHGLSLWNNFWYAGHYSFITYSVLYYPLSAVLGISLLAVLSVAASTWAFTQIVLGRWGRHGVWPARVFATVWAATVLTGAFPFALGMAIGLFALDALLAGRSRRFALLVGLTLATSPLAFLFVAVVVVASGTAVLPAWPRLPPARQRLWVATAIIMGAAGLVELLLWRLFPDGGRYSFPFAELAYAGLFCGVGAALSWSVPRARELRALFIVFAVACLGAFLLPSAVGSNLVRIQWAALPIALLVLSLRGWRPLAPCLVVLGLAGYWNIAPAVGLLTQGEGVTSDNTAYWQPAIGYLHDHLDPSYRVEAVDTVGHWAAAYLPQAGIPLARGWYRQDDYPQNEVLYGKLAPATYLQWLHQMGVEYVVLATDPPDYSGRSEAELIRSGRSGLTPVMTSEDETVYSVPSPAPLVVGPGPAAVVSLTETALTVTVATPGSYRVAVRYSPYWQASAGCLAPNPDGMTDLVVTQPATITLSLRVDPARMVGALLARPAPVCGGN